MTLPPQALASGELHVLGRLAEASNLALLAEISTETGPLRCIYKPVSGERPLWDFPGAALAAREVLTAEVAALLRLGPDPADHLARGGSVRRRHVPGLGGGRRRRPRRAVPLRERSRGVVRGRRGHGADGAPIVLAHESSPQLQRMVILDALVNNADRKGGHVLRRADGSVAGIDHGVTFHAENKLRTVLWGWAGEPIPADLLAEVAEGSEAFRRPRRGVGE